jgi:hypothetical protein
MTTAERVDEIIDALDRHQLGTEYEPESSLPWALVVEQWEVFKLLVDTLDHAVRHPFAARSAIVLAMSSAVLLGLDAVELYSALSHAGDALGLVAASPQSPKKEWSD